LNILKSLEQSNPFLSQNTFLNGPSFSLKPLILIGGLVIVRGIYWGVNSHILIDGHQICLLSPGNHDADGEPIRRLLLDALFILESGETAGCILKTSQHFDMTLDKEMTIL